MCQFHMCHIGVIICLCFQSNKWITNKKKCDKKDAFPHIIKHHKSCSYYIVLYTTLHLLLYWWVWDQAGNYRVLHWSCNYSQTTVAWTLCNSFHQCLSWIHGSMKTGTVLIYCASSTSVTQSIFLPLLLPYSWNYHHHDLQNRDNQCVS